MARRKREERESRRDSGGEAAFNTAKLGKNRSCPAFAFASQEPQLAADPVSGMLRRAACVLGNRLVQQSTRNFRTSTASASDAPGRLLGHRALHLNDQSQPVIHRTRCSSLSGSLSSLIAAVKSTPVGTVANPTTLANLKGHIAGPSYAAAESSSLSPQLQGLLAAGALWILYRADTQVPS